MIYVRGVEYHQTQKSGTMNIHVLLGLVPFSGVYAYVFEQRTKKGSTFQH